MSSAGRTASWRVQGRALALPSTCRRRVGCHLQVMINLVAVFALALLFGGMIFFAAVVAPLVFTRLPAEHAGRFIRAFFPVYYLYVLISSTVAAIALVPRWEGLRWGLWRR